MFLIYIESEQNSVQIVYIEKKLQILNTTDSIFTGKQSIFFNELGAKTLFTIACVLIRAQDVEVAI